MSERGDVLDALRVAVQRTERIRVFEEVRPEILAAYVDLLFAIGHARLGDAARARELAGPASERLHAIEDIVHATLAVAVSSTRTPK